ncbi:MAG: hypothetical protein HN572_02280 [Kordiimonadaceae bacterium]|nr:hypothetical protein [Kordiimonadaceae bacterium]
MVADGTNELATVLKEKAPSSFMWKYVMLEEEEHRTVAAPILSLGLRHYFENYSDFYLPTLDSYIEAGGLDYVRAYFRARAERYGFSPEISSGTMWSMVSRSIIADDFEYFKMLMGEFGPKGFIGDSRLRDALWYAEYFIKYQRYSEALSLYGEAANVHGDASRLFHAIGNVYQLMDDRENATSHYEKAIAIAKAAKEVDLADYEKSLASLNNNE